MHQVISKHRNMKFHNKCIARIQTAPAGIQSDATSILIYQVLKTNVTLIPKLKRILANAVLGINPLTDDKTLDWSKLKQIADNISKCI